MTGLCVIDMQPYYGSSADPILPNVLREVKKAKQENAVIVLVRMIKPSPEPAKSHEYEIYQQIEDELETYDKVVRAGKRYCDGGSSVTKALRRNGYNVANMRVCGVETDACVAATVCSLSKKMRRTKFDVVMDACNHYETKDMPKDRDATFNEMRDLDNVRLIA